ncbi:hypothetical protein [Heyndrickxia oleronia]|uniref:hypothetical protein n=1 Tax=Heyndrickxia oleronia TaxID=38875 RepID=UPI001B1B6E16|nr:hypothetical protein [Heyndrickxia oleronia]GIN37805.1 hypothetical protein J19TS1_07540 [Heyndrickxia oleronia]
MENVKSYRVKTKPVIAMRTYQGMPLSYIRDFMIGCKNISLSLNNIHESFNEPIKSDVSHDLTPGDYIVKNSEQKAVFMSPEEFENRYEERVNSSELHYVIRTYGFPIEDAEYMLQDEKIRAVLLAQLHEQKKASRRTQKANNFHINTQPDADVGGIIKKINENFENAISHAEMR